jgi:subtilisin family serine protease
VGRELVPLFGFPSAGVGVYAAPHRNSEEVSSVINEDPEVQFSGRGLRDEFGAPVVYTENVFIKFADDVPPAHAQEVLRSTGLTVKRVAPYASNGYFAESAPGTGRAVFDLANELLDREDVDLCHPELVREVNRRAAFPQQWHLWIADISGQAIDAHAHVTEAWAVTRGEGTTICVIDDGVDIAHEEFASQGKITAAAQSMTAPRGDDPRPADGDNHGTACAGLACADGSQGASGVAPAAHLMPLRLVSGLGSQDEADALVWAADHGADVISCSWGPPDGQWWNPNDPTHQQVVPLPDSTRLAIDYAVTTGRGGRGCVIAWAAGNGAESVDNDGYASYDKVIAVAACNDVSVRSAYSDFGDAVWCSFPSSNGEPSLTPGIWTTDRTGHAGYNPGSLTQGDLAGNYTDSFGGTSSACPGVAGVVALLLSANPALTSAEVKDVIRDSCDRIDDRPGEYDGSGHSKNYGYGRVNAARVVGAAPRGENP